MNHIAIDTDGGIDDIIAIMAAMACPDVAIIGITTVAGNVSLRQANENITRLLNWLGESSTPTYQGATRSLLGGQVDARYIHGENGMGNVVLPFGGLVRIDRYAPEAIRGYGEYGKKITIVALGPLTNIAISLLLYPSIVNHIERIVVMGGSFGAGNITPAAEFNCFFDPEAFAIVLQHADRIAVDIVPWDVCLRSGGVDIEDIRKRLDAEKRVNKMTLEMLDFFYDTTHNLDDGATVNKKQVCLADVIAMNFALNGGGESEHAMVSVSLESGETRGKTSEGSGYPARIVRNVDREEVLKTIGLLNTLE